MVTETEQTQTEDTNQGWTESIAQADNLEGDAEAEVVAEQDVPEAAAAPETTTEAAPTAAEAVTTPPTAEETRLQGKVAQLTQERTERQQEADEARIQQVALQYAQQLKAQLVQQGWEESQAEQYALAETQSRISEYRNVTATRQLVALQENVPPEVLEGARDEATMRQKAQQHKQMAGPQRAELNAVKQELAQFKTEMRKAQIPAQDYDRPSGASGASSDNDTWIKYGRGELDWGPQVQKAGRALGHL